MDKKKSKTTLAIILVGILGVISIAYAAISTTLYITSGGSATGNPGEGTGADTGATASAGVRFLDAADRDTIQDGTNTGITVSKDATNSVDTATAGTVTIVDTNKTNDTAKIIGTDLGGLGSYVIYQLEVVNDGTKPVYLSSVPEGVINGDSTSLSNNIEVKLYTDATCTNELATGTNTSTGTKSANYLPGKSGDTVFKTTWYVKVSYKTGVDFTPGTFGFDLNPVWSEVTGS